MEAIFHEGYAALFIIITVGIIIGRIKIRGFALDVSAVIFVALAFGHFGFVVPGDFLKFGLLLFIFTIGIQAGPGFFESFVKNGRDQIIITALVIVSGGACTYALAKVYGIQMELAVGVFTGALTSTPGLAAAIEATGNSPMAPIGYGVAYAFGVIGVIISVNLLPRIFGIDLKAEEEKVLQSLRKEYPAIVTRKFRISNPNIDGKQLREIAISTMTGAVISRVLQGDSIFVPSDDSVLHIGDIVKVTGTLEAIDKAHLLLGEDSEVEMPLPSHYDTQWLMVSNKVIINKHYREVALPTYYNATILKIKRSGIEITPNANSQFKYGDKLQVACERENMDNVTKLLGGENQKLSSTDFLPISLGVILGIVLGEITIPIGDISVNLGITGGTLAIALLLGRIGKTGPIVWSMSGHSNHLLRQLGLLMFLATIGTQAGSEMVETIQHYGIKLVFVGAVITIVPIIVGSVVGRFVFKLNFLTLLGVITGAMTSTPALGVINSKSDSNAAPIAYATVYPAALVIIIIVSQILSKIGI